MDLFDFVPQGQKKDENKKEVAAKQPSSSSNKDNVYSVSQLARTIQIRLEQGFPRLAVEGEISTLKKHSSGHIYFNLKDDSAVINAVVWRSAAEKMKVKIEEGMQVVAYGKLTSYPGRSQYQLVIDRIEPAGIGALMQLFEERKEALTKEGLFDEARKKEIPFLPHTIGVITSPTGAVIEDMLHRLKDRGMRHLLLWPVAVQGVGAKEQIAEAIEGFNKLGGIDFPRPDVLIVARGGGSLEDLWAFNEEILVRAVANSDIPIISGVGHEPDVTLCDYAADKRAPTPTAAMEMAVPVEKELVKSLSGFANQLLQTMRSRLSYQAKHLEMLESKLPKPEDTLGRAQQRLDDLEDKLHQRFGHKFTLIKEKFSYLEQQVKPKLLTEFFAKQAHKLERLEQKLCAAPDKKLTQMQNSFDRLSDKFYATAPRLTERKQMGFENLSSRFDRVDLSRQIAQRVESLNKLERMLQALNPDAPLEKGYARVMDEKGQLVRSATSKANNIEIVFADGSRKATFTK